MKDKTKSKKKTRSSSRKNNNNNSNKTVLKFSTKQFKEHRSPGHVLRDKISNLSDYLSPIFKLVFPNFIAVHYAYIIFTTLLCSLMMLPINKQSDAQYIDILLLAASATSQGGLNTVNLNTLSVWQQFCLYMFCLLTTPIFIHGALAFVRLYWFERYFDGIRDWSKRNFKTRRTRTLLHRNMMSTNTQTPTLFTNKPSLSKMLSGRRSDRQMTSYISPDTRTKSRTSLSSYGRRNSNKTYRDKQTYDGSVIDFAKPPKKTEVTFGGADIDIQKRQQHNNNTVKSNYTMKNDVKGNDKTHSLQLDPLNTSKGSRKPQRKNKTQEGEDFQSRLFRGEAIYRDEDDAISDDNSKTDDNIRRHENNMVVNDGADELPIDRDEDVNSALPIDEDPDYFNQRHPHYNSTSELKVNDEMSTKSEPISTDDESEKDDEPQLHFDLPNKQQKSPRKGKLGERTSSGRRMSLYKAMSTSRLDLKNKFQNLKNKSSFNNDYELSNMTNPETVQSIDDIVDMDNLSAEEIEQLIRDPEFQDQIYKSWKKKNNSHNVSGGRPNFKGFGRASSMLSLPRMNTSVSNSNRRKTSENQRTNTKSSLPAMNHRGSVYSKNSEQSQDIPQSNEAFVDDGMDWENGKIDNSGYGQNEDDDVAIEFNDSDSSESDEDYSNENEDDDESYDSEDYGDDDIDLDYNYNNNDDYENFEIVPTSNVKIGRNSKFVGLTDAQKEELGGVEYRALKLLCKYLVGYYLGFNFFATLLYTAWIGAHKSKSLNNYTGNSNAIKTAQLALKDFGINKIWWGFFTASSSFNDLGLTLTPNSMSSFSRSSYVLLWGMFFIIIGNTGFPVFLRFVIWIANKMSPQLSQRKESLQFLLDHPRRCFTLLFPSGPTWWLFLILIVLNGFDWIMFIILDFGSASLKSSLGEGWFRVLNGLYQSVCTRTAGFSTINVAQLSPAVQVSYMLMMYVSVMPLAISIRRTNVYEEQSLGIFHDSREIKKKLKRQFTKRSLGSKDESIQEPLVEDQENPDDNQIENHASSYIGTHLRRQLSFDLWFLFLGLFIICICESKRIQDVNDIHFAIWTVLFEIVSAYGTVGLSLGYPNTDTSFCAQFTKLSKFIVVLLLLRGKHRGLPNSLDRAIMLPSDHLQQLDNKNFRLVNDTTDEEEEQEEHSDDLSDMTPEEDEEEDLGGDNSLSNIRKTRQSFVERDPVLHYLNKRKDQAKHFVHETKHAVLHHD
ncbi:uncharacterized protein HGUI_03358 [Hanseniaspora guilliermondii]|uniref:Potassium transport protein n=1 Tax=Hanseniaspora guilliermondii TaxID=56406 RepID=A0A1L0FNN0_9ASCO|nr:uncharacterized protein HGUI_03358 [Hanseniaspora guilliermondii]